MSIIIIIQYYLPFWRFFYSLLRPNAGETVYLTSPGTTVYKGEKKGKHWFYNTHRLVAFSACKVETWFVFARHCQKGQSLGSNLFQIFDSFCICILHEERKMPNLFPSSNVRNKKRSIPRSVWFDIRNSAAYIARMLRFRIINTIQPSSPLLAVLLQA